MTKSRTLKESALLLKIPLNNDGVATWFANELISQARYFTQVGLSDGSQVMASAPEMLRMIKHHLAHLAILPSVAPKESVCGYFVKITPLSERYYVEVVERYLQREWVLADMFDFLSGKGLEKGIERIRKVVMEFE